MTTRDRSDELRQTIYDALARHAYEAARTAIEAFRPGHEIEAQELLASTFIEEGDGLRATAATKELERLAPGSVYAGYLSARAAFLQGSRRAVAESLESLLAEKRTIAPVYQEKIYNLLGQCYRFFGECEKSAQCYRKAAQAADSLELKALEYSDYLFNCHYLPAGIAEKRRQRAAGYDALFRDVPRFLPRWRTAEKKIRLGYISPDFRNHVVLRFCYVLLTRYDRERFEVFAYANCPEDAYSQKLAEKADAWRNIRSLSAEEAARLIYEDGVDILVDLAGHTRGNSLPVLAYKPAPVQVSGIGYFASTGLSAVDYFIGDPYLDDALTAGEFTEKMLLLPASHFCYTPLGKEPLPAEAPCQRNGYVTFGSFNNFSKVNDEVLLVWRDILRAVPGSRLLLKAGIFDYEDGRSAVRDRLARLGFDSERVETRGETREYLNEYADVDIALDTFPYPGGGTTCDALYMGVPVVTLVDDSHGGRFGASLLHNIGLGELVTASREDYVARAVGLAQDRDLIELLHRDLRGMMQHSPLMDRDGYLHGIEEAYRGIWHAYCDGQKAPGYREVRTLTARLDSFQTAGDEKQALAAADHILAAKPANRPLLEKLAETYIDAKDEMAEAAVRALGVDEKPYGYGFFLEANVAALKKDDEKAASLAKKALEKGDLLPWQTGATHHLLAELYKAHGNPRQAAEEYLQSSRSTDHDFTRLADYSNYLLTRHFISLSAGDHLAAARGYGALLADTPRFSHDRARHQHDKLRLGYISPDFCRHIVACFSQAFFQAADRERFEVFGYAKCREDWVSRDFAAAADQWRNIRALSNKDAAELIFRDEIDILVDLSGHTADNALPILAYKPAPVILSGVGYFDTTGLETVDYFLTDQYTALPGAERHFRERLIRLPHSHLCYTPLSEVSQQVSPPPFSRNGFVVFGSLNQYNKLTEPVLAAWAEILRRLPESRLFLKASTFDEPARCQEIQSRLEGLGFPMDRVDFEGYTHEYFRAYDRIDIALDSFPYPGGGTTCDALYMGVPVISLYGEKHHERFGLSLLTNLGLSELAVSSWEEYTDRAVGLARDAELLAALRRELRPMMRRSPVMDMTLYMRDLEDVYRAIWRDWYAG